MTAPPTTSVRGVNGAVSAAEQLATNAGIAILQAGGNAVDAAIGTNAVMAVVAPHQCGMGGDLFAMVWSAKDKNLYGLNASGRSGALMTRETLASRGRRNIGQGVEAITVPGALSGWAALLEKYGTLSLAQALAPAIRIADEGFPVSPIIAGNWADEENLLKRDAGAAAKRAVQALVGLQAGLRTIAPREHDVAFGAEHEIAPLPVGAPVAADVEALEVDVAGGRIGVGIRPAVAAEDTEIEAGPVVGRRGLHRLGHG